jgi:hypothetical protein
MVKIDWGTMRPTKHERAAVEERLAQVGSLHGLVLSLRRNESGCEASLRLAPWVDSAAVRLRDANVGAAVDRLVKLLAIAAREAGGRP